MCSKRNATCKYSTESARTGSETADEENSEDVNSILGDGKSYGQLLTELAKLSAPLMSCDLFQNILLIGELSCISSI